jgi:hypothetical protein
MGAAADLAYGLDPVLLARAAGYADLDRWQCEVLQARPRRLLLNTARQTGKSLVASILAVHQALYEPRSLAVVCAVAQRQAAEMVRTCRDLYAALGRPEPAVSENKLSLELENGSRILSIPSSEETVRGLSSVRLLVLDEASRIPDSFYGAVLPFLAVSNGSLALLSTPAGCRGFFFDAYKHRDEWFYREVPATACKRISSEFLAEQRRKTGEYFWNQEWACQFNDATSGAFRSADVDRAVRSYPTWNLSQYEPRAADASGQHEEEETPRWNLAQYATR